MYMYASANGSQISSHPPQHLKTGLIFEVVSKMRFLFYNCQCSCLCIFSI